MFRAESKLGQSEINQGLDNLFQTPVQQQMGDAVLAYGAEQKRMESLVRQQIGDGQLPDVKIFDGTAGKFSDAPPNPPALDAQGRAQSINYADGTSRQFTYKDGKIDTYKDRDGHTWKFTPEDIWTQQDGKSVMHGEMIVDKDGSFTFINHDKNYVSHYGADGKEDLSKQKKYDEYTNEEFLALEMAGKQFAATGLPQESAEKPEKNSSASSSDKPSDPEKPEPKPEPRPEPEPEPKPEKPEPKPEPRPEPEPEPKPEKPEPKPEPRPEPKPEPKLEPNPDGAVKPLSTEQVQAFARNFQMDPIEVARIGSLTLEQLRAEMQAIPALERANSQKYRFYSEMVYRLIDGKSSSAYTSSHLT